MNKLTLRIWFEAIFIALNVAALSLVVAWALVELTHTEDAKPAAVPEAIQHKNLTSFYKRSGSGYLMLETAEGWRLITCTLDGWNTQSLYYRHNLNELAEGCHLMRSLEGDEL